MSREHIVILHHTSEQGGGIKSAVDLAVMLSEEYKVTICFPKGSTESVRFVNDYEINCYEMENPIPTLNVYSGAPGIISRRFIKGLCNYIWVDKVAEELLKLKPSVLIFNSIVTSFVAKKIPDYVKTICFIRETFVDSIFNNYFKMLLSKYFDGVAYIANHEKEYLNIKGVKQEIIPDTLEPQSYVMIDRKEARIKCDLEQDVFYILYMGGSSIIKGFDVMLEATRFLGNKTCVLVLGKVDWKRFSVRNILFHLHNIKATKYYIRTRRLLTRLKSDSRIKYLGYRSDISNIMCACDVVVPSNMPHQPRPCIEAGMYKKPVIISDYKATSEYFIDNYNALTFIPRNGKDLANKIQIIKNDNNLKNTIAENNYKMSIKKHNYYKIQRLVRSFVKEIVEV